VTQGFDMRAGLYELEFEAEPGIGAPTEIYVSAIQYPHGHAVEVTGPAAIESNADQRLLVTATGQGRVHVAIRRSAA
jgi:hypothetical protein